MKKLVALFMAAILLFCSFAATAMAGSAEDENYNIVRVAFPLQEGLTQIDENGVASGYTFDYISTIAQYTNWKLELVEVEGNINQRITTLIEMLEKGEIDIMGDFLYSDYYAETLNYSALPYGYVETQLQAAPANAMAVMSAISHGDTIRVATYSNANVRRSELEAYLEISGAKAVYIQYGSLDEQIEAVRNGKVDALLNTSLTPVEDITVVARFASKPFYFATSQKADGGIAEELNMAMLKLEQSNPFMQEMLRKKYFEIKHTVEFSESELEEAKALGVLRAGVFDYDPPHSYINQYTDELDGLIVEVLDNICGQLGTEIEYVSYNSIETLIEAFKAGEIDIMPALHSAFISDCEVPITEPYIMSANVIVINADANPNSMNDMHLVYCDGRTVAADPNDFVSASTLNECIELVNSSTAYYTHVDSFSAQYYASQRGDYHLRILPSGLPDYAMCFAISPPKSQALLPIFNKAIYNLKLSDISDIALNVLSYKPSRPLGAILKDNLAIIICAVVLLLIAIVTAAVYRRRDRKRLNKLKRVDIQKQGQFFNLVGEYIFEYNYQDDSFTFSRSIRESPEYHNLFEKLDTGELLQARLSFINEIKTRPDSTDDIQLTGENKERYWFRMTLKTIYDGGVPVFAVGKLTKPSVDKGM